MSEDRSINQTITELTELVNMQQKALNTSDRLLVLKDSLLDMVEEQNKIVLRELTCTRVLVIGLAILDGLLFYLHLVK